MSKDVIDSFLILGILGVLVEPFFARDEGIFYKGNKLDPWVHLGVNCLGVISIAAWSGVWSFVIFGLLKSHNLLRVDEHTEVLGHDLLHHGEAAYPLDAWLEYQYETEQSKKTNAVDKVISHSKSLNNEIPADSCVSNEKGLNIFPPSKPIDGQNESSSWSSNDNQRKVSSTFSSDDNIGNGVSRSVNNNNLQLRQSSCTTIQNIIEGEVNMGYVEDTSIYSKSPINKRHRTISTTTQTTNNDCVRYTNAAVSIGNKGTLGSTDGKEESVDAKISVDTISLKSITV